MRLLIIFIIIVFVIVSLIGAVMISHLKITDSIREVIPINLPEKILPSQGENPREIPKTESGLYYDNVCKVGSCTYTGSSEVMNYLDVNGNWRKIVNNITKLNDSEYYYIASRGIYKMYFKENPSEDRAIKFYGDGVIDKTNNITLYLTPYALMYRNGKQTQIINYTQNVVGYPIDHVFPSEHIQFNALDTMFYPNIFGAGTNLTIEYGKSVMKKRLYIEPSALPIPTINTNGMTLDIVFKISTDSGWDLNGVEIDGKVPLKVNGIELAELKRPTAKEKFHWIDNQSVQNSVNSKYGFFKTGNDYYVSIRTAYTFISNTNLITPLEIDPNIGISIITGGDDVADIGTTPTYDDDDTAYSVPHATATSNSIMGVRFQNVEIPNSATITDANLTLTTWATCAARGGCIIGCYGVATDDASAWDSSTNRPKDAVLTTQFGGLTASVSDVANGAYVTRYCITGTGIPSTKIKDVVFNITNRTGWVSGNDMSFVIKKISVGTGNHMEIDTYEYGMPVVLTATYTVPEPPPVESCWRYNSGEYFLPTRCGCFCTGDKKYLNLSNCGCYLASEYGGVRLVENFTDGEYTNNPVWTVKSGTWDASQFVLNETTNLDEWDVINTSFSPFSYSNYEFIFNVTWIDDYYQWNLYLGNKSDDLYYPTYLFRQKNLGSGSTNLLQFQNWSHTMTINDTDIELVEGSSNVIKINRSLDTGALKLYVNGVLKISSSDFNVTALDGIKISVNALGGEFPNFDYVTKFDDIQWREL